MKGQRYTCTWIQLCSLWKLISFQSLQIRLVSHSSPCNKNNYAPVLECVFVGLALNLCRLHEESSHHCQLNLFTPGSETKIDFTLSNTRRFYSSRGSDSGVIGLKTHLLPFCQFLSAVRLTEQPIGGSRELKRRKKMAGVLRVIYIVQELVVK